MAKTILKSPPQCLKFWQTQSGFQEWEKAMEKFRKETPKLRDLICEKCNAIRKAEGE